MSPTPQYASHRPWPDRSDSVYTEAPQSGLWISFGTYYRQASPCHSQPAGRHQVGHSSHVFLLTSQTGIFSSPPSEPRPQQLPATSSILMQSLWPHKLCSGYFFPEQRYIRTLPLIRTAVLWVSTVNSSFKRFSLMVSPLKVSVWDYTCTFLLYFVSIWIILQVKKSQYSSGALLWFLPWGIRFWGLCQLAN